MKIALSESKCFHIGGDKVNGCDFSVNCGRSRKKGKGITSIVLLFPVLC